MRDTDLMPWGTHKNKPVGEVPFDYFLKRYRAGGLEGEPNKELKKWFENICKELEEYEKIESERTGKKPKKYIIENIEIEND
jgi:hypothetical protein